MNDRNTYHRAASWVQFEEVMRLLDVSEKEVHRRIAHGILPRFMTFEGTRYFNGDALPPRLRRPM